MSNNILCDIITLGDNMENKNIVVAVIIIIMLSISAYFVHSLGAKYDISNKGIINNPVNEDPNLKEINDNDLVNELISPYKDNLFYNSCELNGKVLNELYSGNMNVDSLSNETLFLIGVNDEEFLDSILTINKTDLNNKVNLMLNDNINIDFDKLTGGVGNYLILENTEDVIQIHVKNDTCEVKDSIIQSTIRGEENDEFIYVYQKIAFGKAIDNKLIYFNDSKLNNQIESYDYTNEININIEQYQIYKYTFTKDSATHKLVSITTA